MIQTKKISENIYNFRVIGYRDINFHGPIYKTDHGSSYNAYLVIDEQVTLIDTVEAEYSAEFLKVVEKVLDGRSIDNIIINHVEPDHSSSFIDVVQKYPNSKNFCSERAEKFMQNMFFNDVEYTTVKTGDTLSTGKYNFKFILTPFVHWPDNMVTYLEEEKILFSNDAFGNLTVSTKTFDDEFELVDLQNSSKEYYANIIMPCGRFVLKALKEIEDLQLEIKMICPSHGIIWRSFIPQIIENYKKWANFESKKDKVVIVYDTIWGNTELLTDDLGSELANLGLDVKVFRVSEYRPSLIMSEILDASAVIVGTGNFNGTMLPTIAGFIERMFALKPKNKIGAVYGSYGWAKTHLQRMKDRLVECEINVLDFDTSSNFNPDSENVEVTKQLASIIYEALGVDEE